MAEKKHVITKAELERILANRVSLNYYSHQKRVQGKEFNDKVELQQRILHGSNTYIQPLTFDECTFNESVDIGVYENAGEVIFYNCIFNSTIRVHLGNSSFTGVCIFNNDLTTQLKPGKEAEISEYNVKGQFEIFGTAPKLVLKNINQGRNIKDEKIKISAQLSSLLIESVSGRTLEFSNSTHVEKMLVVEDVNVSDLIVDMLLLHAEMTLSKCKITNLHIIEISGNSRVLKIENSTIGEFKLRMNKLNKTSIIKSSILNLELSDINAEGSIFNIEKTTIIRLKFGGVYNKGLITMKELIIPLKGTVSFKSSNLGKADFIYCNFSKAVLEFENSKITEAFFSETEFPKIVLVDGLKNYGQAQLAFGQLATAFQKQGDNIRALEYNSRELEAHYKNIKLFSANFFQKINLWLNAVSNNFGRNWFLGTIFSFSVGILFFCLLLISTERYSWGFPEFDFNLIPAYLKFMNPLRFFELESLFNNTSQEGVIKLNGRSYLADFGGRIFIAYGYYQTIQAFRRFGRK